jgi:hypothetical protein
MFDMAQPQAVDTANQPIQSEDAAVNGTQEGAQELDNAAFLTVRYNKEELPLSREAAAVYAQKGLNYDKVSGRLEKAQELLTAYEDIGAAARDYAHKNGISEAEALAAIKERLDVERQNQSSVNAQLDEFLKAHPDIDPRALPEAVIHAWKNGTPLITAYAQMKERELMREHARQTNARNTEASMGGAIGMGAAAPRPMTEDAIKMMSSAELDRNHSRIWAFLTGQKE